ncbi:MAG: hypothetical protein M3454_14195 [Actinomycetota bacterium]|nr:hypothetical protein [Actinomycetota bacterium]
MHSLTLLMSTEHLRDLQRQAAKARLAKAAGRSATHRTDSGPTPTKRSLLHNLLSLKLTHRHPEEARWS